MSVCPFWRCFSRKWLTCAYFLFGICVRFAIQPTSPNLTQPNDIVTDCFHKESSESFFNKCHATKQRLTSWGMQMACVCRFISRRPPPPPPSPTNTLGLRDTRCRNFVVLESPIHIHDLLWLLVWKTDYICDGDDDDDDGDDDYDDDEEELKFLLRSCPHCKPSGCAWSPWRIETKLVICLNRCSENLNEDWQTLDLNLSLRTTLLLSFEHPTSFDILETFSFSPAWRFCSRCQFTWPQCLELWCASLFSTFVILWWLTTLPCRDGILFSTCSFCSGSQLEVSCREACVFTFGGYKPDIR